MHKNILWLSKGIQLLLMEIMTISIVCNIFPAFNINPLLSSNLGIIILCSAIPLLILNLCFFSKKSGLISASIGIVLVISGVIMAKNAGVFSNLKNFEFFYSFYIIVLITSIITFAASKFRLSLIVLFLAAVIIFAALTILAYKTSWIFLVIFLMSTAILHTFKFYCNNIKLFHTKKIMLFRYTLIACIFSFICIVVSAGIYSAVKAENLPVQKPSILTNATFLQLGKKYGFATIVKAPPQPEKQPIETQQTPINNNNEKPKQQQAPVNNTNEKPKQQSPSTPPHSSLEQNHGRKKEVTKFNTITYFKKWSIIAIIAIITTMLILIFVFKKVFRTIWYRNLLKTDQKNQIIELYSRILKTLSVFGYKRNSSNTPFEFANKLCTDKNSITFDKYDFRQITDIFAKVNYGEDKVSKDDYNKIVSFYKNILPYCRKDAGIFKFIIKCLIL